MNSLNTFSSNVKNRFFCSECHTFKHCFNKCIVVRNKRRFLLLIKFQLDHVITTEESLIDLLRKLTRMKLDIIAKEYGLISPNAMNQSELIRNIANIMILRQSSQSIAKNNRLLSLREVITPSAPPLPYNEYFKYPPIPSAPPMYNDDDNKEECCICFEVKSANEYIKTACNHEFCRSCIDEYLKINNKKSCSCPLCRGDIHIIM